MLRYLIFVLVVLTVFVVAVVFAALNPAPLELDLAFTQVRIKTSLALVSFMGAGWLLGLLCVGFLHLSLMGERRQLRKALGRAQAELNYLRSAPGRDAD